jgi:hypothetical protein
MARVEDRGWCRADVEVAEFEAEEKAKDRVKGMKQ